jgi:hypothetical protein
MKTGIGITALELRNYLVRSGVRERFHRYFEDHFIGSQEELGGYPLGQFRIKDEDNRFFWLRGFESMTARSRFLPAFYGGPAWKQYGPAANAMMLEWHQVHLLRPLNGSVRSDVIASPCGMLVVDYYVAKDDRLDELVTFFQSQYLPFLFASGIDGSTLWISEMGENDFPRLPVIQNPNLLVVLTPFESEEIYRSKVRETHFNSFGSRNKLQDLVAEKESMMLYPVGNNKQSINI